jgi:hypothetical protein
MDHKETTWQTSSTTWLIIAIIAGLPASAALVVALVAVIGLPLPAGLLLLASLDVGIIVGGYAAVRRSFRTPDKRVRVKRALGKQNGGGA